MENLAPYFICLVAFAIHKDRANLAAVSLFIFFYSISLVFHTVILEDQAIYKINLVLTACFLAILSKFTKITLMMLVLSITSVILTSIDFGAYITYTDKAEQYQFFYVIERPIIILQYAALLITDGEKINVSRYFSDMLVYMRHSAMRLRNR